MFTDRAECSAISYIQDVHIIIDDKDHDGARSRLVMRLIGRWTGDLKKVILGLI